MTTSDGKQIQFDLGFTLSRNQRQDTNVSLRLGDAARKKDPLVVNLNGLTAQLSNVNFRFDLDNDGKPKEVNFIAPGSGFLVIDRNQNGRIDNGSELFGPQTGDGFSELAQFDLDRNGWIDEADPIFSKLKIWTKDAEGKDKLDSLKELKIGALFVQSTTTDFALKNEQHELQGQIRSSSVYVTEEGKAGTIQQIDLVA